jgi:organic radical activating enzyme
MQKLVTSEYDFSLIPFDDIQSFGQISLLYKDLFNVSWLLGRYCNYKCSYCWPYARSDQKDHRSLATLLKALQEIKEQARKNNFNSFHFSFSGGEPSLHPSLIDLLKTISDDQHACHYQSTHMTTNLSPGIGWFKKYTEATKGLSRVSITASWHKEFSKRVDFKDKIHFLQDNNVHVTINMVMVPSLFDELYEDALYFHDHRINVTLKPQSNPSASRVVDDYTEEQLKILHNNMPQCNYTEIKRQGEIAQQKISQNMQVELTDGQNKKWYIDQAERFNAFNFNQFIGWNCHAGFQGIVIREPDGLVKRSYSCHDKPLGHIETGFKIFDKPEKCITHSCVSSVDSKMPKFKDKLSE